METKTGLDDFFSSELPGMEAEAQVPQKPVVKEAPVLTPVEQELYDNFSPKEKEGVRAIMDQMDFKDPNLRSTYGKKAREGIAEVSTQSLAVARVRDMGEAGKSITNLVKQLKGVDIDLKDRSRGIFTRARSAWEEFNVKLNSVEENIEKSVAIMQGHQTQLADDNVLLDALYKQNLGFYKSLTRYIIVGKLKLAEERKTTLAALKAKTATGDMEAIEAHNEYKEKLDSFEKLLDEFESVKLQCMQNAPMLRMAMSNNEALIREFDFISFTAVPTWKNKLQLMLVQENTRRAGEAIDTVIDFHNELILENARRLGENTVAAARISEREITETATLEEANRILLDSLNQVMDIHKEGRDKRAQSREDKARIEEEMKNELLRLAQA